MAIVRGWFAMQYQIMSRNSGASFGKHVNSRAGVDSARSMALVEDILLLSGGLRVSERVVCFCKKISMVDEEDVVLEVECGEGMTGKLGWRTEDLKI